MDKNYFSCNQIAHKVNFVCTCAFFVVPSDICLGFITITITTF